MERVRDGTTYSSCAPRPVLHLGHHSARVAWPWDACACATLRQGKGRIKNRLPAPPGRGCCRKKAAASSSGRLACRRGPTFVGKCLSLRSSFHVCSWVVHMVQEGDTRHTHSHPRGRQVGRCLVGWWYASTFKKASTGRHWCAGADLML